jgi:hypothetical protein
LFPEDDVTFDDGTRRKVLADQPMYMAGEWSLTIRFGESWNGPDERQSDGFRIRVSARAMTGELMSRDADLQLMRVQRGGSGGRTIDNETLLEFYPGVENTPAAGDAFVGRTDELERLNDVLVSARQPSPVLLTGMRRIGKTSLLFAFHTRNRQPGQTEAVSIYLSLAERRSQLMRPDHNVGTVFFGAITHTLAKRHFSSADRNREVGQRIQARLGGDRSAVRRAIEDCQDPESLADSLILLGERILEWVGGGCRRVVFLIDEAETLVLPYRAGGAKRLELEQLLQSLREVSQSLFD